MEPEYWAKEGYGNLTSEIDSICLHSGSGSGVNFSKIVGCVKVERRKVEGEGTDKFLWRLEG